MEPDLAPRYPRACMPHDPEALRALVATSFPLEVGDRAVYASEVALDPDGALTCRLASLGTDMQVEGPCRLVPAAQVADPRALAWWQATRDSLLAWLGDGGASPSWVFDLLFPEALDDLSLQTPDQFAAALADPRRRDAWFDQRLRADVLPWLERIGIADRLDEFLALPRPVVFLEDATRAEPRDDEYADDEYADPAPHDPDAPAPPVGGTRLGGEPDLPPDLPWPSVDGVPLTFAAQLDLAELRPLRAARELPPEGLLSFFYEPLADVRDDVHVDHRSRVLHFPALADLRRRPTPPDGDPRPEYTVTPVGGEIMPPLDSPFYEALLPEDRVAAFHRRLRDGVTPIADPLADLPALLGEHPEWLAGQDDPKHRVLGHCVTFQGDVYLEAEAAAARLPWQLPGPDTDAGIALSRRARRWRLLLQLSADGDGELLFNQDSGYVYFMIPEDDLAARRWDRVQVVTQFG